MINLCCALEGDLNAKELFILTTVDRDDPEDTTSVLWQANDEDHLYELVKNMYCGYPDEQDESMFMRLVDKFDEEWGITILYTKIANIT